MLAIKNNLMAVQVARHLGTSYDALSKSVERLSTGLRINSAKDDAAGLAVRELLRADIAVLQQGSRNAQDGISMFQTMEAVMQVMDENLVRMKELAEQAATGSYSSAQRAIMDSEFAEMSDEIERVANAIKFNDITMLNEDPSATNAVAIHVGTTQTIDVDKVNMTKKGLNIETGDGGWQVDSSTVNGVSSESASWLTILEGSDAADGTVTMSLVFVDSGTTTNNESAIDVAFTAGQITSGGDTTGFTSYSLAQVVAAINAESMDLGWDASGNDLRYSAASTYYDSTSSSYVLRLQSRDTNADSVSITWSDIGAGTSKGWVSGGFYATGDNAFDASDELVTSLGMSNSGVTQAGLNIKTVDAAVAAMLRIDTAINIKDTARAAFGYKMNRLESTISILGIQAENLGAAESRISDVDVATEMAKLTSTQVLSQAGVAMLAQANSIPQMALTLLR
jgi:flagellin